MNSWIRYSRIILCNVLYMNYIERAIHISSIDRQKFGVSKPEDFTIKFTPQLHLDPNMQHELALDKISMTYSWHNITQEYQNNKIRYSHEAGSSWNTITFPDGMYSYSDLNDFIHNSMEVDGYKSPDGTYDINLLFILSTYKVVIELSNNFRLDLTVSNFGDLIGFDKKIVTSTEYGSRLPNITNSIDSLHINCDLISDSIVSGVSTNTLFVVATDNLRRSNPFTIEPRRALYNEISSSMISSIRIYVLDSLKRPVDLNGIDWYMNLILRSTSM